MSISNFPAYYFHKCHIFWSITSSYTTSYLGIQIGKCLQTLNKKPKLGNLVTYNLSFTTLKIQF